MLLTAVSFTLDNDGKKVVYIRLSTLAERRSVTFWADSPIEEVNMGILRRLVESKKAREEREEAERTEVINVFTCERCGKFDLQIKPIQLRTHGTDNTVKQYLCSDCFNKAASMAEGIGIEFK